MANTPKIRAVGDWLSEGMEIKWERSNEKVDPISEKKYVLLFIKLDKP